MELKGLSIRNAVGSDVDFVHAMLLSEEWNDRREDAARMLGFEPEGCFLTEVNNVRAGHVFSITYGSLLAWIGYVIVKAEYRNRGIATLLMKKALDYLRGKRVQTVKLEAVPEIANVYRKLGFTDEYDSLRFAGTSRHSDLPRDSIVKSLTPSLIAEIARFDATYFGPDRTRVLSKLYDEFPELCFVARGASGVEGYVMCRRAEFGYKLGPWVCRPENPEAAKQLLVACLSATELNSKIFIGTPAPNTTATRILQEYGFTQYSKSIRMRLGKPANDRIAGIFAIGGPMKG
jgi:ribosomal protein S18 acetylase RimI-like enzyme